MSHNVISSAIEVRGLGKEYVIGASESSPGETIAESVKRMLMSPRRRFKRLSGHANESERFWALRDVSFDVRKGEVVGVVGGNGAGKSTLLRILSRITAPTTGTVVIDGNVSSLLEVGTGFHPELSGRENIFLNGAILGLSRKQIQQRFREIVAFSGVEKFLDTPVKRYSSGMRVRLAFAVAAHLDPDILIVDEVLAVGDLAFQTKCLGRMQDVAGQGRTVLFVSHNLSAVRKLCPRSIWLDKGRVVKDGPTEDVLAAFVRHQCGKLESAAELPSAEKDSPGFGRKLTTANSRGEFQSVFRIGEEITISFEFEISRAVCRCIAGVGIVSADQIPIATFWSKESSLDPGVYRVSFCCGLPLSAGDFRFVVGLSENESNFYYHEGIGHVSISEVAVGQQPVRSRAGILVTSQRPAIVKVK